jgi:regulation of enolase protein 1 (concanavalin A-like superfamily)
LEIFTDEQTDFWQNTHYGFQRDNGHCLFTPRHSARTQPDSAQILYPLLKSAR